MCYEYPASQFSFLPIQHHEDFKGENAQTLQKMPKGKKLDPQIVKQHSHQLLPNKTLPTKKSVDEMFGSHLGFAKEAQLIIGQTWRKKHKETHQRTAGVFFPVKYPTTH